MWWTALIAPISKIVGTWQEKRAQVNDAKHEANLARIKDASSSWKDEILLLMWGYPVTAAFIPPLHENTVKAFEFIHDLPSWYVGGWLAISLAIFGVDKVAKFKR